MKALHEYILLALYKNYFNSKRGYYTPMLTGLKYPTYKYRN